MSAPTNDPENSAGHWARAKVEYAEDLTRVILKLASIARLTEPQRVMDNTLPTPGLHALAMEHQLVHGYDYGTEVTK